MNKKLAFVLPSLALPFVLVSCQPSKDIKKIEVTPANKKLVYQVGEVINKEDLNVKIIYSDKTEKELKTSEWTSKTAFPYRFNHLDKNEGYANIDVRFGKSKTSYQVGVAPFFEFDRMAIGYDDTTPFTVPLFNDEYTYLNYVEYKIYGDSNKRIEFSDSENPSNTIKMKSDLAASDDEAVLYAVLKDGSSEGFLLDGCTITSKYSTSNFEFDADGNFGISGSESDLVMPYFKEDKRIEKLSFNNDTNLKTIVLPSTLKEIKDSSSNGVFSSASNLEKVDTSNCSYLATLGDKTFNGCAKLTSFDIPASLENIGASCFNGCSKLETLNIPANNSIRNIGSSAFNGCTNIQKNEKVSETEENYDTYIKTNVDGAINEHYILYSLNSNRDNWEISDRCKIICCDLKDSTHSSEELVLPDNLEIICEGALKSLTLASVKIGSGIKTIGKGSLTKFTEISIADCDNWYYIKDNKVEEISSDDMGKTSKIKELLETYDLYHIA